MNVEKLPEDLLAELATMLDQAGASDETKRVTIGSLWTMEHVPSIESEEQATRYRRAANDLWKTRSSDPQAMIAFARSPDGLLATAYDNRVLEWEDAEE